MSSEIMAFGELLRGYRIEAELTQSELAERAGVGLETIGALERGINKRPRKSTVARLSQVLDLGERDRTLFESYANPRPRIRPSVKSAFSTGRFGNCPTCPIDCASAPGVWGEILPAICRQRR